jgi:hypothetical protein
MPTWKDLERDFQELQEPLQYSRLDAQWGSAGEYWRLAGTHNSNVERQFEALSYIAGEKLSNALQSSSAESHYEVLNEPNPLWRWYKGIWKISQNFEHAFTARELDENDEVVGHIFTGSITHPTEASSVFCLELAARFPDPEGEDHQEVVPTVQQTVMNTFWEQYGRPILIGVLITVLSGLILATVLQA